MTVWKATKYFKVFVECRSAISKWCRTRLGASNGIASRKGKCNFVESVFAESMSLDLKTKDFGAAAFDTC